MNPKPFISVVIPVYSSETLLGRLISALTTELKNICSSFEIILVEDGSPDGSWQLIKKICKHHPDVIGLRLSRNFGQHYAISAGLCRARGNWVVVMDCDMQDRPSEISKLFAKANEGYDVVLARRAVRQDGWWKCASSAFFHAVLSWLTGVRWDPKIANFGVYSDKVVEVINDMPESIRYFPTMVRWVGFSRATVDVSHSPRPEGQSSYSIRKLLHLALEICLANSDKPLRLAVCSGFSISAIGFIFALYTGLQAWRGKIEVLGYASLMVSLWVLSGLIIFIVGVVGLYVGKAFEGIKGRPAFIIAEEIKSPDLGE